MVELFQRSQHALDVFVRLFCAHGFQAVVHALILLDQIVEQQPPLLLRFRVRDEVPEENLRDL